MQKFHDLPNYSNVLLEAKGFIELANIKYKINESLQTTESVLHGFLLIDQLAEINYKTRLKSML